MPWTKVTLFRGGSGRDSAVPQFAREEPSSIRGTAPDLHVASPVDNWRPTSDRRQGPFEAGHLRRPLVPDEDLAIADRQTGCTQLGQQLVVPGANRVLALEDGLVRGHQHDIVGQEGEERVRGIRAQRGQQPVRGAIDSGPKGRPAWRRSPWSSGTGGCGKEGEEAGEAVGYMQFGAPAKGRDQSR